MLTFWGLCNGVSHYNQYHQYFGYFWHMEQNCQRCATEAEIVHKMVDDALFEHLDQYAMEDPRPIRHKYTNDTEASLYSRPIGVARYHILKRVFRSSFFSHWNLSVVELCSLDTNLSCYVLSMRTRGDNVGSCGSYQCWQ